MNSEERKLSELVLEILQEQGQMTSKKLWWDHVHSFYLQRSIISSQRSIIMALRYLEAQGKVCRRHPYGYAKAAVWKVKGESK